MIQKKIMKIKQIMSTLSLFLLMFALPATASVTMIKTRVIYSANSQSETLNLTNDDDTPYIMQVWVDEGDAQSTPKTATGTYILTPPIFKIAPKAGQSIRLIYSGDNPPQDRESVAYLNIAQVPPNTSAENELSVVLRHRVKIFYRPKLAIPVEKVSEHINFLVDKQNLTIQNQSPYYVTLASVKAINTDGKEIAMKPVMVAPFSNEELNTLKNNKPNLGTVKTINYEYMNDLGGLVSEKYSLKS